MERVYKHYYYIIRGINIMYTRKEIDLNKPLSEDQIKMLEALKDTEPSYDEDCPELSDEELKEFKRAVDIQKDNNRRETVTLRLPAKTLKKAKSLGKGYTSILSRIIEKTLDDVEMLKKCL